MKVTDEQIIRGIRELTDRYGYSPTLRELAMHLGLASQGSLSTRIDRLVVKGMLAREDGKPRTLRVRQN